MAKALSSVELTVPADQVWHLIGGFGSLPDWLPFIPKSELREVGVRATSPTRTGVQSSHGSWHSMKKSAATLTTFFKRRFRSRTTTRP